MSKLTAKQIDDRVTRMLLHTQRLFEAGEITKDVYHETLKDLAKWAGQKYARLPIAEFMDGMLRLMDRPAHDRLPPR